MIYPDYTTIYSDYMQGPVTPNPVANGPSKPWVSTDDVLLTCVACDGENCDLERTSLIDERGGRKTITVGLHSYCFASTIGVGEFLIFQSTRILATQARILALQESRDAALGVVAETKRLAQQESVHAANERDVLRSRVRELESQLANVARLTAQHAQMRESLEWIVARCGPRIRDFRSAALRMSERASATLWKLA
jgi:hypothetical protein